MALTVYGARYSVYARILGVALKEAAIPHDWVETDVFDDPEARAAQARRHPFAKIPAIDHDGFTLYETAACLRYLESGAFGPPRLTPETPRDRARADQIIGLLDAYGYAAMVWDVFVEATKTPPDAPDLSRIAAGLDRANRVLGAISEIADDARAETLIARAPSLADVFLAPMLAYFDQTGQGRATVDAHPRLRRWFEAWSERPSMRATRYPAERDG